MSKAKGGKTDLPRILHLQSSFNAGGKELRTVRLINAFAAKAEHAIVSAEKGQYQAASAIAKGAKVRYPRKFPSLTGWPTPGRLHALAKAMQDYDLVLTYNWGAMDAVLAHTLFAASMGLPALIHHEDGFNADEADGLKWQRNWYRRLALGRAAGVVVPSRGLHNVARHVWHQPEARVHRIPNGISVASFRKKPKPDAMRRLIKQKGERWVGTLAGLREVKNLPLMVRAFAALPQDWHLVILGEGPQRERLEDEAERLGIQPRVHLPGHVDDPASVIGLFDIFALSSASEQFPLSVVEAMAAGLPVAATDVGDVAEILSPANAELLVAPGDEAGFTQMLTDLAKNDAQRESLGAQNRARAKEQFDELRMISAYRALYSRFLPGGKLL